MSIVLRPETQKLVEEQMKRGGFRTADDVVAAALATLDQQQAIAELDSFEVSALYPEIRQKLAQGLAAARARKLIDGDAFFDELEREEESLGKGNQGE